MTNVLIPKLETNVVFTVPVLVMNHVVVSRVNATLATNQPRVELSA